MRGIRKYRGGVKGLFELKKYRGGVRRRTSKGGVSVKGRNKRGVKGRGKRQGKERGN